MSTEPQSTQVTSGDEPPPPAYGTIENPPPPSQPPSNTGPTGSGGSVPPGYREGGYPDEPPPSYYDLYGNVKDIRQQSSGPVDFFKKLFLFLLGTLACTICVGFVVAIPVAMIVIGAVYKDDCPAERYIPIYLIVGGSFGLVKNVLNLFQRFKHRRQENADDAEHVKQSPVDGLLNCFLLAWFIAGCVWVYGLTPNTKDTNLPGYCNPVVYYFAFWLLTTVFIFLALTCCCMCCAGCLGYLFTNENENNTAGNSNNG